MKNNLTITPATLDDLCALELLEKECEAYFAFDPPCAAEHNRSLRECLEIGDIIPGVAQENYRRRNYQFDCIWNDGVLIGWLAYYLEYQQTETAYLSVMYIKEECRSGGVGAEVMGWLTGKLAGAGYKTIKTHCSLRNATALCFWVRQGFDRILEVECDGNLWPGKFGGLELMKTIA